MERKAVIFDLFETLITEWGHKKYTKNEMCADLGLERERFDAYWEGSRAPERREWRPSRPNGTPTSSPISAKACPAS